VTGVTLLRFAIRLHGGKYRLRRDLHIFQHAQLHEKTERLDTVLGSDSRLDST
jgi:hypothetical protein